MEKIEFTGNSPHPRNERNKKTGKKYRTSGIGFFDAAGEAESDFSFYLSSAVNDSVPIEQLLDDVHTAGERLVEKPFISNIKEYREAVGRFMAYIVKNGFSAESETQTKKYIKNGLPFVDEKKWTKVKVVNEKLEKLALYIMQSQKSQLTILKKIEEIEGILVDLLG